MSTASSSSSVTTPRASRPGKKKVYLIDLRRVGADNFLEKRLVLDLLAIPDPEDRCRRRPGSSASATRSRSRYSRWSLEVLGGEQLLIASDNNYPFSDGRWIARDRPDDTELIVVIPPHCASNQAARGEEQPVRQPTRKPTRRRIGAVLTVALAVMVVVAGAGLAATSVKPYVEPVGDQYQVRALFGVDDKVPLLGGAAGQQYRMVGIPDGLGAHPNGDGTSRHSRRTGLHRAVGASGRRTPATHGAIVSRWLWTPMGTRWPASAPTTGSMPRTPCLGRPGGRQRGPDAPPAGPVLLGLFGRPGQRVRPAYLSDQRGVGRRRKLRWQGRPVGRHLRQ